MKRQEDKREHPRLVGIDRKVSSKDMKKNGDRVKKRVSAACGASAQGDPYQGGERAVHSIVHTRTLIINDHRLAGL